MRKSMKKIITFMLALSLAVTPVPTSVETKAANSLPSAVDLSESPYFPDIVYQLGGSCVTMSTVYYQFTYEMNKAMGRPSTKENVFSPYAVYNMFYTNDGGGGVDQTACYEVLKDYGVPLWKDLDYQHYASNYNEGKQLEATYEFKADDCYANADIWAKRSDYRLSKYDFISKDSDMNKTIQRLKEALNNGKVISFLSPSYGWKYDYIEDSPKGSSNHKYAQESIIYGIFDNIGKHEVTFVGYDDNIWFDYDKDEQVDEGEKGAFKFANSWGNQWENDGYCWMTYESLRREPENMAGGFGTIEVEPYNSDSNLKLYVDMDCPNLLDSTVTILAYEKETGKKYQKCLAPFTTFGETAIEIINRGFSYDSSHGTLAYDLSLLVPGINVNNFNDYYYEFAVSDNGFKDGDTVLYDAYIYYENNNGTKERLASLNTPIGESGVSLSNSFYESVLKKNYDNGFDFKVENVKYNNISNTSNDYYAKDIVMVDDVLEFTSTIKNVGDVKSTDNNKIGVLYTITDQYGNNVNIPNVWSDNHRNKPGLDPQESVEVTTNGGGINKDGKISFSKPGTYIVTAWVNDDNSFPNEYGGNCATNNKKSITITVIEKNVMKITSWDISASNNYIQNGEEITINKGDTVYVTANLESPCDTKSKMTVYTLSYNLYANPEYVDGNVSSYKFERTGTFYIGVTITNNTTGIIESKNYTVKVVDEPIETTTQEITTEEVTTTEEITTIEEVTTTEELVSGYDLIVTDISLPNTANIGDNVIFNVTVKNAGDIDIASGTVIGYQIQIDGNTSDILWCDTYSNGLKAGQSIKLTVNSGSRGVNYWKATSGSHKVMAWVDDVNRIGGEYDENNNQFTKYIDIPVVEETTTEEVTTTEAPIEETTTTNNELLTVESLTIDKDKVKKNDSALFILNGVNKTNVATKIVLYSPYDRYQTPIAETDFVIGTSVSMKIDHVGLLAAYAIVKDLDTNTTVKVNSNNSLTCAETLGGYDFAVKELAVNNLTKNTTTFVQKDEEGKTILNNLTINAGDTIKLGAKIENVGDMTPEFNRKLGVQFQINGDTSNITWCDNFSSVMSLIPRESVVLMACGGNVNTDGNIRFDQPGTYYITAWVNDVNDYPNEVGGYQAENNKVTFEIVVK